MTTCPNRRALLLRLTALPLLAALVVGVLVAPSLGANDDDDKKPEVTITNKDQVYYPSVIKKNAKFTKPATLLTSTVFDEIAEWKEIKKKKLTESDAEYHLLLTAANKKFRKAVKKVQKDGKYDIIAESGAIKCKNVEVDDVSQKTVDALPKD